MSAELSFAELEAQDVELLPARTVLSTLVLMGRNNNWCTNHSCNVNTANAFNINVSPQIQTGVAISVLGGNANVWQLQANQTWQSAIAKAH